MQPAWGYPAPPVVVGDVLDVPAAGFVLPEMCCKCGVRNDLRKRFETLSWVSNATYTVAFLTVPAGLLVPLLVIAAGRKNLPTILPICGECDAQWRRASRLRALVMWATLVVPLVTGLAGAGAAATVFTFLGTLIVLVPIAAAIMNRQLLRPASVYPIRIEGYRAQLRGFSDRVLEAIATSPNPGAFLPTMPQPMPKSYGWVWAVLAVAAIPLLGIFAVVGVYGVRKYIGNAKSMEARNTVTQIATLAAKQYNETGKLCRSASHPVPDNTWSIAAHKYQSSPQDWADAGFGCFGFALGTPQYFQYDYQSDGHSFSVIAHGDFNGDGKLSTYSRHAHMDADGKLVVEELREFSPLE